MPIRSQDYMPPATGADRVPGWVFLAGMLVYLVAAWTLVVWLVWVLLGVIS